MGTAAMNSNSIFLSVVEMLGIIVNCPASVPASGLLAKTDSDDSPSSTYPYTPTLSKSYHFVVFVLCIIVDGSYHIISNDDE